MSPQLQRDLSSDRNMGWVPPTGWLSYLALIAPGRSVTYDMNVSPAGAIGLAAMGTAPAPPQLRPVAAAPATGGGPRPWRAVEAAVASLAGAALLACGLWRLRRRVSVG